ncbi:MAG TPA: hypothetical protein VGR30_12595 [Candidatus Binatia bacterium]|nr:hypothetical protein [Candidatus Binatia bacterium]
MRKIVGLVGLLLLAILFASTPSSQQFGYTLCVNKTDPPPGGIRHSEKISGDHGSFLQQHGIEASFNLIVDGFRRYSST